MLPPLSPLPPPSTQMRLATFNIGLGFTRKLPSLLDHCSTLALDVVALQEIGDPAVTRQDLSQYRLIAAPGPTAHQSGVGLLIADGLTPRCRAYKRSSTGRLVGVILELSRGHQLLIVSAYMPSGLDHRAAADDQIAAAHSLYNELLGWTRGVQQVVVMGDLNETLSDRDRQPSLLHRRADGPIQCLVEEGFTDAYRLLHPEDDGFTHYINNHRSSRSRIDYIWTCNTPPASHCRISIDHSKRLRQMSHHRLLWIELEILSSPAPNSAPLYQMRIPNLRAASEDQQQAFITALDEQLNRRHADLDAMAAAASRDSLTALATELTDIARQAAFDKLPITGGAPRRPAALLQLQRRLRDITRLRSCTLALAGENLTHSPEWVRLWLRCTQAHDVRWHTDPRIDIVAWTIETQQHINESRSSIAATRRRLRQHRPAPIDANPAARIHRLLNSDALPSELFSVINEHNELTSTPAELEDVMVTHFENVFAIPPPDPAPLHPPPPAMLLHKPGIDQSWFDGLMDEVNEEELMQLLSTTPLISAPGQDEVSTGVWKLALEGSSAARAHVASLFTACLRTATFPSAWKTSVILPLVKDASKDRKMSNIRPISLQSCLGKLLSKLLAHRLGRIFQQHPILNPAQRGFVLGGTTMKCIDELLDAWDWSRTNSRELYSIFYDIKQAYDSVQPDVLARAMRRLRVPETFIRLIVDSLTHLSSCIRTTYGLTRCFAVRRSLRQGDPLAPLLFVILMDALHDGLEVNPFTNERHGCVLEYPAASIDLPSLGYADDSNILANSLRDLFVQNEWVQYFMRFNLLRLNPLKCELVGRGPDGLPVTQAALDAHNITIDGMRLTPLAHNQPIRYLGVHSCFDGSWKEQQNKTLATIARFTRLALKFHLSIQETVYMFNVFLTSRLELALHYVHGPGTSAWIKNCDKLMVGCIKHLASSPLRLSHTALATTLHFILPSRLERSIKVSELFLRLNSSDPRWGRLGREIFRQQLPSLVDDASPLPGPNRGTRITRAAYVTSRKLRWSLHLCEERQAAGRRRHLFDTDVIDGAPQPEQCSTSSSIELTRCTTRVAHDCWIGWGATEPRTDLVHVYTDGSYDAWSASSAWAVVIGDRWLVDNHTSVPTECLMQLPDVGGVALFGANITCSQGVYPAELQAIARTLAMLPLSFDLHIHSDSKASIAAIQSFGRELNERARLRMAARTVLQLIDRLVTHRQGAGGSLTLSHVRAHTDDDDIHSVGNRIADFQANRARDKHTHHLPIGLKQLPLADCEQHLHVKHLTDGRVVIDDIRRSSRNTTRAQDLTYWSAKKDHQGTFACDGTIELGRAVLKSGSKAQQCTLVHVATNSIHRYWSQPNEPEATLEQVQCTDCNAALTLDHLATCFSPLCVDFRAELHSSLLMMIESCDDTRNWMRANRGGDLLSLYLRLFPLAVIATAEEVALHPSRCLIGAYTHRECTSAVKALGIHDLEEGRSLLTQLRLISLDHIDTLYSKLKAASP